MQPLIPEHVKPLALQAILYFTMAKMEGKTRSEAVAGFIGSPMCRAFGDRFTVGNVYGLAEAGGYERWSPCVPALAPVARAGPPER